MRSRSEARPARRAQDSPAEVEQRRRQARGLLLIALAVLAASILHTGIHRVFTIGWWRLW